MTVRPDPCARLALALALPVGVVGGLAAGCPPVGALLVGGFVTALLLVGALAQRISQVCRPIRRAGRHRLLALLAVGMPQDWGADWAEEMQVQLDELPPRRRLALLVNLLTTAPAHWAGAWNARLQHTARRFRGDELRLAALLRAALTPSGPDTATLDLLRAAGLSRSGERLPARQVPALVLARQLLSTTGPRLAAARRHAGDLLALRERVHLIIRELHRDRLAGWLARPDDRAARLRAELDDLRRRARQQAGDLLRDLPDGR